MEPGAAIRQEALAERLEVSRVPLREALKTLEGEGLVSYRAHRGYRVVELSMADLREVYRLREILEAEAVRAAVPLLDEVVFTRLEAAQSEVELAAEDGAVAAMAAANRRFHFALFEAAAMPRLVRMIGTLWDSTDAYRSLYYAGDENRRHVVAEHRAAWRRCARGTPRVPCGGSTGIGPLRWRRWRDSSRGEYRASVECRMSNVEYRSDRGLSPRYVEG